MKHQDQTYVKIPQPSILLIGCSLLCVPGVYVVLLISCAISACLAAGAIAILYIGFVEEHRVNYGLIMLTLATTFLCGGVLCSLWAKIKGLVISIKRSKRMEPALLIDLSREPTFSSFLHQMCESLGTQLPDSVILHAFPTFFVAQGKIRVMNGFTKGRVLSIGVPYLHTLTIHEIQTILAHEFAHFTGRDTLYSSIVCPAYIGSSITWDSLQRIFEQGEGVRYGFWLQLPLKMSMSFLNIFMRVFHLINMKISRSREQRADMIAVLTCGSDSFATSLKKTIGIDSAFAKFFDEYVQNHNQSKPGDNLYRDFLDKLPQLQDVIQQCEEEALAMVEDKNNSHPSIPNRIQSIPCVKKDLDPTILSKTSDTLFQYMHLYEEVLTSIFSSNKSQEKAS